MKRLLLSASVLLVALSAASSVIAAPGINMAWTDCRGDGGVTNRAFACASNTGSNTMVVSYVAPAGVTGLTGNELVVDVISTTSPLPAWWQYKNASTCRQTALSANFTAPGSIVNCVDYWSGQAAGGIGAYTQVAPGGGWTIPLGVEAQHARMVIAIAVPAGAVGPIDADVEYFSANIVFNNTKTVGTGACAGCADPVCIVLNSVKLTQAVGIGDFTLTTPTAVGANLVTWQGTGADCNAVPVRNATWGAVKSLYR